MDSNTGQFGLSWHLWLKEEKNKKLFDKSPHEALKQFKSDGEEYIHNLILQERIVLERQRQIILDLEKQSYEENKILLESNREDQNINVMSSGAGGASSSQTSSPSPTPEIEILTQAGDFLTTQAGVNLITQQ